MGKIEREFETATAPGKYARVMHHIGGFGGKNDNSDMLRGGEDELNLITMSDLQSTGLDEAGAKRLFDLGALREATPDEVKRFEINKGIRDAEPDEDAFTNFTTGNETLKFEEGKTGAVQAAGGKDAAGTDTSKAGTQQTGTGAGAQGEGEGNGEPSGGSASYKGMTKGELSEYTVPELKGFAKDENIEGYNDMLKPALLDALTNLPAKSE